MLEVVFSDSAKGAMKVAKNYNKDAMIGGATAYFGKKPSKRELEKQHEGQAIGGSSGDVVGIGMNFDIGDIRGDIDSKERKHEFVRVFGSIHFKEHEVEDFFRMQCQDFDRMLTAAKSGETLRVWTSSAPFSACAFAFLCDALRDITCELSVVALPEYWLTGNTTLQSYMGWGEVHPGQFYRFLPLARKIPDMEKCVRSTVWQELKEENAPLRALVNSKLISVPEDFYDTIIMKNIPDGEFVMAWLIGTILGKYPLGVSDGWYALRIKKMIADGVLEIVADRDPTHPYGKVLRKT